MPVIDKVKSALKSEVNTNLPILQQYISEIRLYNLNERKPKDIFNLQKKKFQQSAYQSISMNVSLLDTDLHEKVYA